MPRRAKFREERILEAVSEIIAVNGSGAATIAGIAIAIGAPRGSIYHRFRSRDELLRHLVTAGSLLPERLAAIGAS